MKKWLIYLLFLINLAAVVLLGLWTFNRTERAGPVIGVRGTPVDTVNTGTGENTGTGDPIRDAFIKINDALNIINAAKLYDITELPDSLLARYTKTQANTTFGNVYSTTTNLTAGVEADVTLTGVTSEPYALWIIDSDGLNITEAVKDSTAISGGVYHTYIYSVDAKTDVKIKVLW